MKLAHDTLLLVLDGAQMLLLRNEGDTVHPDLAVIKNCKAGEPANRAALSDAPGVGFVSAGFGRDSYGKADPHQEDEDRFVAEAAEALEQAISGQEGGLIVVAPPTALGVLRKHYSPTVKKRVIAEIAKNFTNHTVDQIARQIMAHDV